MNNLSVEHMPLYWLLRISVPKSGSKQLLGILPVNELMRILQRKDW